VQVLLLGTAAGGGFPQWNCWCPVCRVARSNPELARPRTQSSLAVSADGARWFLCNASPDVHEQLARLAPACVEGTRHVPVEGIVLTDAELDHSLGIALLREGRSLALWATASVLHTLECDSHIIPVTRAFARVETTELQPDGAPTALSYRDGAPSGLTVECFAVPGDPPRFASDDSPGHTVGVIVRDEETGGSCAFVPGCGALDGGLEARLSSVDALLFDGTFWTEDELVRLGIGDRPAAAMGHLPISGPSGSLARLATLPCQHKVYTHINNSNPILIERSPERSAVEKAGLRVGMDGMCISI
jgi:pyrroloquinoline quinone biosynthesis protein B